MKQVGKDHYVFSRYMTKKRWASLWYQISEISNIEVGNVLEVGPGLGMLKPVLSSLGVDVKTLDIDPELKPDCVGSAEALPFESNSFDVVCGFQVLEHFPYDTAISAYEEMVRVAKKYIIISVPDVSPMFVFQINFPKVRTLTIKVPWLVMRFRRHIFDGEHYWELNKRGYSLDKLVLDMTFQRGVKLNKTYRVSENPYHRFFVFEIE